MVLLRDASIPARRSPGFRPDSSPHPSIRTRPVRAPVLTHPSTTIRRAAQKRDTMCTIPPTPRQAPCRHRALGPGRSRQRAGRPPTRDGWVGATLPHMLSQAWPGGRTRRRPAAPINGQFLSPAAALEAFTPVRLGPRRHLLVLWLDAEGQAFLQLRL